MNNLTRGGNVSISRFVTLVNSICKGKITIFTSKYQPEGEVYCVDILDHVKNSRELRMFPYHENVLNRMDKRYCAVVNEVDLKYIPKKPNIIIFERGNSNGN